MSNQFSKINDIITVIDGSIKKDMNAAYTLGIVRQMLCEVRNDKWQDGLKGIAKLYKYKRK